VSTLRLLPGKERSVLRRHPWVFAASVDRIEGRARPGDTVTVAAADGRLLARASWSPSSQIRARIWSFDAAETIDDAFFRRRIDAACDRRTALPALADQPGLRLVHGESDGLPGVIADRYRDCAVVQLNSAGAEKWRTAIVGALLRQPGIARVFERSDSEVRRLEGLEPVAGWLHGGGDTSIGIVENGVHYAVDVVGGHKTGFYLDQRDNRRLLATLAGGRQVLNCFCYTGGFSLQALAGGAESVLSIDSSAPALAQARDNLARNPGLPAARAAWLDEDVFLALRRFRDEGRRFDLVILDPPKFAPSAAHAARAARAYKDINLLAFRLLAPEGLLMSYSCSGGIGIDLFQKIVAGAALDAAVDARIVARLFAAADHPVGLAFPEGEYLKGLLVQAT
jgi:23S rRNA (cytosine1962-C5)-methyltransferase